MAASHQNLRNKSNDFSTENLGNTHNTHDMATSSPLNQADVAILDTCSPAHSNVQTLGKVGYLYFLVRLYQKLVSEGVAKDDVCLNQLISEIKSISLDDNSNLGSVARMLAQKPGPFDASGRVRIASTSRGADPLRIYIVLDALDELASENLHVFMLPRCLSNLHIPYVNALSIKGPESLTTLTSAVNQVSHNREMEHWKIAQACLLLLAGSRERTAQKLTLTPKHLDTSIHLHIEPAMRVLWRCVRFEDFLKVPHINHAGGFDNEPELYSALYYGCHKWATESAAESAQSKALSFDSFSINWTTSEDGLSNAKDSRIRVSISRHLRSGTQAHNINQRKIHPPTESSAADTSNSISTEASSVRSETPVPRSEDGTCAPVPTGSFTDSSQRGLATSNTTTQPDLHDNSLERRMDEILDDWERCQEDGVSDSDSSNDFDSIAEECSISDVGVDPKAGLSREKCFTRHGDAPPSGASDSSMINGKSSGSGLRISKDDLLGTARQSSQSTEDGDYSESLIADSHLARNEKSSGKVLPCPIEGCRGKDPCMSELLRKLQTLEHGKDKFICQDCWCLFKTLKDLNGHKPSCEDHCVIIGCKPELAPENDVRHKCVGGSCVVQGDAGGIRETRKEDEYRYLCGLLGVPPKPLEEGSLTPHNNQRKSASRRAVGQEAVNHAAEATRRNTSLQNQNRELRQHNKELVQILQQTLEEYERMVPQVSKALYRRIEDIADHAPSILEEFPQSINPFSNATLRPQNSSSVSSLGSLSSSSSTGSLSDGRKRESRVIDVSNGLQSKRRCMATSSSEEAIGTHTLLKERSTRMRNEESRYAKRPRSCATIDHAEHQRDFAQNNSAQSSSAESNFQQSQETRTPSTTPHTHPTLSRVNMPTRFYSGSLPEPQSRPATPSVGICVPPIPTFGNSNVPPGEFEFDALGFSNDPMFGDMGLLEPNDWNNYDTASLLNAPPHSGALINDSFPYDFPMD